MGTLTGKIAWVTGAGGGIGEASAIALAVSGAHVVLSGRRQAELDRVAADITAAGGKAETAQLDVADALATQAIADDIGARLGGIDIFMANAGINVPNRSIAAITATDFAKVVDVNLNGVMNGVLAVLPQMRTKGAETLILTVAADWSGIYRLKTCSCGAKPFDQPRRGRERHSLYSADAGRSCHPDHAIAAQAAVS